MSLTPGGPKLPPELAAQILAEQQATTSGKNNTNVIVIAVSIVVIALGAMIILRPSGGSGEESAATPDVTNPDSSMPPGGTDRHDTISHEQPDVVVDEPTEAERAAEIRERQERLDDLLSQLYDREVQVINEPIERLEADIEAAQATLAQAQAHFEEIRETIERTEAEIAALTSPAAVGGAPEEEPGDSLPEIVAVVIQAANAVQRASEAVENLWADLEVQRAAHENALESVDEVRDQRERILSRPPRTESEATRFANELRGIDGRLAEAIREARQKGEQLSATQGRYAQAFQQLMSHWSALRRAAADSARHDDGAPDVRAFLAAVEARTTAESAWAAANRVVLDTEASLNNLRSRHAAATTAWDAAVQTRSDAYRLWRAAEGQIVVMHTDYDNFLMTQPDRERYYRRWETWEEERRRREAEIRAKRREANQLQSEHRNAEREVSATNRERSQLSRSIRGVQSDLRTHERQVEQAAAELNAKTQDLFATLNPLRERLQIDDPAGAGAEAGDLEQRLRELNARLRDARAARPRAIHAVRNAESAVTRLRQSLDGTRQRAGEPTRRDFDLANAAPGTVNRFVAALADDARRHNDREFRELVQQVESFLREQR